MSSDRDDLEAQIRKIRLAHVQMIGEHLGDVWQEVASILPIDVEHKDPEDRTPYENHVRATRSLAHNAFKEMAKAVRILMDEDKKLREQ